jgi:hypothetical protein
VDQRAAGLARPGAVRRQVTLWVDKTTLHVLLEGAQIKTPPSRPGVTDLARLAATGAGPAGPSPLLTGTTAVIQVGRTVNATGATQTKRCDPMAIVTLDAR